MYREERERGVTVQVLDMSALEAQALAFRQISRPDCYEAKIHGGEVAVARSRDGILYSICTEGVGPDDGIGAILADGSKTTLELNFHGTYHVRDEETGEISTSSHTFDMFPFASIELDDEELLEYPVKREEDLADFIRSFGARLERNFWLWFKVLS